MAIIHVINGQLKVVESFSGKSPDTKDFYFNGELCSIEIDKVTSKLIIKKSDNQEVLLELEIK